MSAREPNLSRLGHVHVQLHLPDEDVAVPRELGLLRAGDDVEDGATVIRDAQVELCSKSPYAPASYHPRMSLILFYHPNLLNFQCTKHYTHFGV